MAEIELKQRKFAIEYLVDFNATKAAIRAGYADGPGAQVQGARLMANAMVMATIESHLRDRAIAAGLTRESAIRDLLEIARDPRGCCRYCHGLEHQYQWTEKEYSRALDRALSDGKPAPDAAGGFDYVKRREPLDDCPECKGEGVALNARKLPEKSSDRVKAYALACQIAGLITNKSEVSGPGGSPIQLQAVRPASEWTEDELALYLASAPLPVLPDPDGSSGAPAQLGVGSGVLEGNTKSNPLEST